MYQSHNNILKLMNILKVAQKKDIEYDNMKNYENYRWYCYQGK